MISIDKLIDNQSVSNPSRIAIKHGERTVTYREVNEISGKLAGFFRDKQVKDDDVVGVAIDRSPEMVIALLAVIKAGATYLPIDTNLPIDRVDYMLKDAGVKLLVTTERLKEKYAGSVDQLILIEDAVREGENYDPSYLPESIGPERVAYIIYTSGSTGKPKGVQCTHGGLVNLLLSVQKEPGLNADDIVLNTTTISFDIAELEVFLPLICGALLILVDADMVKDGRSLIEIAKTEKITLMQGTPFMWRMMLEAGWDELLPMKIIAGGEAMPKELARKLVVRVNGFWNMYGPTETTIYSTRKKISIDDEVITIGIPIEETEVYLLDENLNRVADGEVGELYINGTGVAKGYINKPELTAEKFTPDKFSDVAGMVMYRTGDLGKILKNGEIQCLGRIDHQIKIRGYRIETEEIEHVLKQQKNVDNAIVTVYTDALESVHLVAYLKLVTPLENDDHSESIKSWKTALKAKLPEYMVPDMYMVIDTVPLTTNGKIDRKALPEPVMKQYTSTDFQEPKNDTERTLLAICLKSIAVDKISVTDSLFDLGIDSLRAVGIMVQIEKILGKRLPLSILLKYPTIRLLSSLLDGEIQHSPYKCLVPIKPEGTKAPLYIVHGIGLNLLNLQKLALSLNDDQPVYGLQSIGLDGTMEMPDTIEAIANFYVNEVIAHNPNGPYLIAGYSFGGVIAFEMAKQLQEMGKEVKLLAMIDTNIQYPSHHYSFLRKYWVKLIRQFKKIFFRIYTIFTQPKELMEYIRSENTPEEIPDYIVALADKMYAAFYRYTVKPVNVRIVLFKASVRMYFIDDAKFLGWGKYALNGVEVHNVPGDHKDMLHPVNVKILADALQNKLNQIQ